MRSKSSRMSSASEILILNSEPLGREQGAAPDPSDGIFILPVSMRSQPTFSKSGTMSVEGNTTKSISSISLSTNASSTDRVRLSVVSDSGLTAGYSYYIFNVNDASAYLDFDAEL